MLDHVGLGIISLIIYIGIILVLNVGFGRRASESMMWSYIVLIIIAGTFGAKMTYSQAFTKSFVYATHSEVVYAAMGFVFMSYLMQKTGIILRLVNILNALIGRLPGGSGYVSTLGSVLFGLVSGSGSGNAAAVGSITIPWMMKTGWSPKRATEICAGNADMGMVFPPSTSMLILMGTESIAAELSSGDLYVGLLGAGAIILIARLAVIWYFAKKDGLQPIPADQIMPLGQALKENGSSLLLFFGIAIPLIATMGPTGDFLKAALNAGAKGAFKSISIVFWIPITMSIAAMIEGWKYLPHDLSGWGDLIKKSIGKYSEVGMLLFTAFAASGLLNQLGMTKELNAIFTELGSYSPALVIFLVAALVTMMAGPFSGPASTSAVGLAAYTALRSIGLPPVVCCVAFLDLVSNAGAIPPSAAPIYIACGISGLEDPASTFKPLLVWYVLPVIVISLLIMFQIIPVIGA